MACLSISTVYSASSIRASVGALNIQAALDLRRFTKSWASVILDTYGAKPNNTMSLDPPTYLSSLQNNIRQRPIPWEGAVRAGTITDDQLSKIRAIDKVRKEQRKQTIEDDLGTYLALFLGRDGKPGVVESAASAKRSDVVQYCLVLIGDVLEGWCCYLLEG